MYVPFLALFPALWPMRAWVWRDVRSAFLSFSPNASFIANLMIRGTSTVHHVTARVMSHCQLRCTSVKQAEPRERHFDQNSFFIDRRVTPQQSSLLNRAQDTAPKHSSPRVSQVL